MMDEYEFKLHETEEIACDFFECFREVVEETGYRAFEESELTEIMEEVKDEPEWVRDGYLFLKGFMKGLKEHSD